MGCKACGTSEYIHIYIESKLEKYYGIVAHRLPVLGHQVRRQLRLQPAMQVRLQERTQGQVLLRQKVITYEYIKTIS